MNYSNMIEEKHLKKTFIIATLVSTLVGTFTATMSLHDKIQEKRDKSKQKAVDGKQTDEIDQLKEKLEKLDQRESVKGGSKSHSSHSRSRSRSSSRRRRRRRDDLYDEDEEFAHSARRSRAMIERMYEDNLRRGGMQYAQGDVITENKLQAQIIQLQQTVINVLQDALYSGRPLTRTDMERLIAAQHAAREGSLDALEGQYSRLQAEKRAPQRIAPEPHNPSRYLEDIYAPPLPPQRQLAHQPTRSSSLSARATRGGATSLPSPPPDLYCRYAETLQLGPRLLSQAFTPSGDGRCHACRSALPVDTRDVWVFNTQGVREYQMDARFVVKCHTPDGRFACVLCSRFREVDCICRDVEALIKHLATLHSPEEFERDVDLLRKGSSSRELVLAA